MKNFSNNSPRFWWIGLFLICLSFSCSDEEDPIVSNTLMVDAGSDIEAAFGEEIILDGSNTFDEMNRSISYQWEFVSTPDGSSPSLVGSNTATPSFVPDGVGEYAGRLTASTEVDQGTDMVLVMVDAQVVEIRGNINDVTETWRKTTPDGMVDYRVVGRVTLNRSTITVEPGVIIEMAQDAEIRVNNESGFDATGSEEEVIQILGREDVPGYWGGIRFNTNNPNNKLIHVHISDGGQGSQNDQGMISFGTNGRLTLENSRIENSSSSGVVLSPVTNRDVAHFEHRNNSYKNNNYPVATRADNFHFFDSESDYSGNTNDLIGYAGNNGSVTEAVSWQSINVPYYTGQLVITGDLTIEAGVELHISDDRKIMVNNSGRLNVAGTADEPVIITGRETDLKGYWQGIEILTLSDNQIHHAIIRGAGSSVVRSGSRRSAVILHDGRLNISSSQIVNTNGNGIFLRGNNNQLEHDNLTFENIEGDEFAD